MPDRTAERCNEQPLAELRQTIRGIGDAGEPNSDLIAEADGSRMLLIAASHAGRRAMPVGQTSEPGQDRADIDSDQLQRIAHAQNKGGIDDVLRGRTLVEGPLQFRCQPRLHRLDERDRRHAGYAGTPADRSDVQILGADRLDRGGQRCRRQAALALTARQRRFDGQHAADPRRVGEAGPHRVGREQRPEQFGIERGEAHCAAMLELPLRCAVHPSGPLTKSQMKSAISSGASQIAR